MDDPFKKFGLVFPREGLFARCWLASWLPAKRIATKYIVKLAMARPCCLGETVTLDAVVRAFGPGWFDNSRSDDGLFRVSLSRTKDTYAPVIPDVAQNSDPERLERKGLQHSDVAAMQVVVTNFSDQTTPSLSALGWSSFFADQLDPDEAGLDRMRIATVHRTRLTAESEGGPVRLRLPANAKTTDFAVGDWALVEPATHMFVRRLDRQTLLQRRTEGGRGPQLIAANVDTLLIVTSCNDDFNPARLERYLALANESGAKPVVVLTKIDKTADATPFLRQAEALQRGLDVVMLNAKAPEAALTLAPWCGPGQTVALVGSSGVGKSTLLNTLSAKPPEDAQPTGGIREDDAKGRHTTTSRSLHAIVGGGLVIDTPGMRTLHVSDVSAGLDTLFAEIVELAPECRFRDCTHTHEPGCAVLAGIADGTLDPARVDRWRKLLAENQSNTPIQSGARGNKTLKTPGKRR